jgi:hypothetical protein
MAPSEEVRATRKKSDVRESDEDRDTEQTGLSVASLRLGSGYGRRALCLASLGLQGKFSQPQISTGVQKPFSPGGMPETGEPSTITFIQVPSNRRIMSWTNTRSCSSRMSRGLV